MITSSVLHYKLQRLLKGKKKHVYHPENTACEFEDAQLTVIMPQRLLFLCLPAETLEKQKERESRKKEIQALTSSLKGFGAFLLFGRKVPEVKIRFTR